MGIAAKHYLLTLMSVDDGIEDLRMGFGTDVSD